MSIDATWVEIASVDELARRQAAWRALVDRAAEPNVFADPAFLLPALRRLAPERLTPLLIWRDTRRSALIGLIVLRKPLFGLGLARPWRSEQAGLAAMLFDRDALEGAVAAILAWARPRCAGIVWSAVEREGPLARALSALATRERLRLDVVNPRRRAALIVAGEERFDAGLDKKRRKDWARQARRLAERGALSADVADSEAAIEDFLGLEAKGWKGARATALAAEPERLAFAREMLAAFRERGQLQIHALALDGEAAGIGVVLLAGARAFYWKTAYDESLAEFSPGVQLTLALSRRLARESGLSLVDSCALQDHPMIDRIWPGRLEFVDLAIAPTPEGAARLGAWLAADRLARQARERLKRIVNRLRGGKRV